MQRRRNPPSEQDAAALRAGSTAAGLLGGCLLGLLLVLVVSMTGAKHLAPFVFIGTALIGAVAGFLNSGSGVGLAEVALHAVIGFASGVAGANPEPSRLAPRWLRAVLVLGVVLGLAFLYFPRW
jgi:hypothetical protein